MSQWCEHCRGHYPTDHYDNDEGYHQAGHEYGPVGAQLLATQIVRALDRENAPVERDDPECLFCGATDVYDSTRDVLLHVDFVEGHDPACPWRLAREWVAAQPD